jgi:hypothetical protein
MPLPVAVSVVSVAGFAVILVILVQPLIFSDVHVAGREGTDVNAVFPEIFTLVTLVPTSSKAVSPVGKVGSVVSDVQPDKFRPVVPVGNPPILVIAAPTIVNAVGNPVHPVRFSVVHVAGSVGTDVNPVSPATLTVVSLVLVRFKAVSPVGKVGSVVSDGQPDKFRLKVPVGNPPILVIAAPTIVNAVGKPEHCDRFSVVSAAGKVGNDVSPVHTARFSDLHVNGRVGTDVNVLFPEMSTLVTLVPTRFKLVSPVGKAVSVVSDGQPDKFRPVVPPGNPEIVVISAPEIVNAVGNLLQPVRFSSVHVAGRAGNDGS